MPQSDHSNSGNSTAVKRRRHDSPTSPVSPSQQHSHSPHVPVSSSIGPPPSSATTFRSVTACNRCRLRKNRCDQRIPACTQCEKAGVKCVGYDPITKREIPRSYVSYLEDRVAYLEALLHNHSIPFSPASTFFPNAGGIAGSSPRDSNHPASPSRNGLDSASDKASPTFVKPPTPASTHDTPSIITINPGNRPLDEVDIKPDPTLNTINMIPVQATSDPRYLGSTSGISFARVVFAAVQSSGAKSNASSPNFSPAGSSRRHRTSLAHPAPHGGVREPDMRDNFFGLQTRSAVEPAPFPPETLGRKLVDLFFEYSNCQIPILHRGEFMKLVDSAYSTKPGEQRTAQVLYLLNIVFAIGAGIFLDKTPSPSPMPPSGEYNHSSLEPHRHPTPESYHAAAVLHLEEFLRASAGGLEELQAVLLLAGYAILRPISPGVWYIVGVAMRLAIDLGLFTEEVALPGVGDDGPKGWRRDMRRRLFWCTYSLDRLIATCVGRPVGLGDEVIGIEFPSYLPDEYITPDGIKTPASPPAATYKCVSYSYFRLRLLQSEILQVHHYQQTHNHPNSAPQHVHPTNLNLVTPFLANFKSLKDWRRDIDRRLREWFDAGPKTKDATSVSFSLEFLELNYWQTLMMLYRPSLSVPESLADELDVDSGKGGAAGIRDRDEEERVYILVAEAGMKVLRLYRQLHRLRQVNYTYLAVHHLFMAGISFLYAIWHSPVVRQRLSMDEVDFTILAATSVLGDLADKCPPAEACKDAFERMSRATVTMCLSGNNGGSAESFSSAASRSGRNSNPTSPGAKRKRATVDSQFRELFDGNDEVVARGTGAGKIPKVNASPVGTGASIGGTQRFVDRGFHSIISERPLDEEDEEDEDYVGTVKAQDADARSEEARRTAAAEAMVAASGGNVGFKEHQPHQHPRHFFPWVLTASTYSST